MGNKVLVIDDDKFIRLVYESKLKKEGFIVSSAQDGEEGFEKISKEKPDLVLLDMILPKKNGFAILEEMGSDAKLKKIPVIVFSALSQPSDIDRALKLGAKRYLPKDEYSPTEIVNEVKKILK